MMQVELLILIWTKLRIGLIYGLLPSFLITMKQCYYHEIETDQITWHYTSMAIQEVTSHNHLGIYFSQNLDWQVHIDFMIGKAQSRLNLLRSQKFTLNWKSLQKIYFIFICSILEYADVVWDNWNQQQASDLEKIQLEAAKKVTGITKLVEITKLYKEVGWLKLSQWHDLHKLFLLYKMQNCLSPHYLCNLLSPRVGDNLPYSLRNPENSQQIPARTQSYGNSFLPSTIAEWNNLSSSIKNADSLNSFKRLLEQETPKLPEYYNTGNRHAQILHTRLRTNCSALNEHRFKRNLVPTPNCSCGAPETNCHYLLNCPRYTVPRAEMLATLRQILQYNMYITTNIYLYGSNGINNDTNVAVFHSIHKFI